MSADRISIGGKEEKGIDGGLPSARLEIIILGKRVARDVTPEEIIVRGQWK